MEGEGQNYAINFKLQWNRIQVGTLSAVESIKDETPHQALAHWTFLQYICICQ